MKIKIRIGDKGPPWWSPTRWLNKLVLVPRMWRQLLPCLYRNPLHHAVVCSGLAAALGYVSCPFGLLDCRPLPVRVVSVKENFVTS